MQQSEENKENIAREKTTVASRAASGNALESVSKEPRVIDPPPDTPGDEAALADSEVLRQEAPVEDGTSANAPQQDQTAYVTHEQDEYDSDETVSSPQENRSINLASVLEAVLFAADEPITTAKLSEIAGDVGIREVKDHIEKLNEKYAKMDCAFRIEAIAGGFLMLTLPEYKPWLSKLIKVRSESRLSAAALETLAIIAYKQPILRVDIESIRGVGAGEMIRQLIEKGLVKIVGRAEELGRPLLYGTTKKFLEVFGLNSLKDLPASDDLKNPDKK